MSSLGIIGGGQLGMFICQAAKSLGIKTSIFSENPEFSAKKTNKPKKSNKSKKSTKSTKQKKINTEKNSKLNIRKFLNSLDNIRTAV